MPYLPPFERFRARIAVTEFLGQSTASLALDDLHRMIRQLLAPIVVDEAWYLRRYPDVAAAIQQGRAKSARDHFFNNGYFEGRWPTPIIVDEAWYLAEYPEVAQAVRAGVVDSAQKHFEENGYSEGRRPFADPDRPAPAPA